MSQVGIYGGSMDKRISKYYLKSTIKYYCIKLHLLFIKVLLFESTIGFRITMELYRV